MELDFAIVFAPLKYRGPTRPTYEGQNGLCIICLENDPIFISKGPFWFLTPEMDSFRPNKLKLGQQRHFANAQAHTKNRDHRLPVALMAALYFAFFCINNLESTVCVSC